MEEALEQYLALAKSAKGKAMESLILQALGDPHTFVFGELLWLTGASGASEGHLELLKIFAYGTYNDYLGNAERLPQLTSGHIRKLKMLTLASLAATETFIPFSVLQGKLSVESIRELEGIIIDSIYERLITGKIDHKQSALKVMSSFGRDVPPENVPVLLGKLRGFVGHLEEVERFIEQQRGMVLSFKEANSLRRTEFQLKYEEMKALAMTELEMNSKEDGRVFQNPLELLGLKRGFFK